MDYTNERYVRVYTRDTPQILMWPWEVASLWWSFLRKPDRAGVIDLGKHDAAEVIALLLRTATMPPIDLVREALRHWLKAGCVELRELPSGDRLLLVPNFMEAQDARQADAARARASRELRRAKGRLTDGVTNRDMPSQDTTDPSHAVTPAVPCAADPSTAPPTAPPSQNVTASSEPPKQEPKPPREPKGTRIPDNWAPTEALYEWARKHKEVRFGREEVESIAEEFRDFWIGVPGAKGRKTNWDATFRNRLKAVREKRPDLPEPGAEPHREPPPPEWKGTYQPRRFPSSGAKPTIGGVKAAIDDLGTIPEPDTAAGGT